MVVPGAAAAFLNRGYGVGATGCGRSSGSAARAGCAGVTPDAAVRVDGAWG